MKKLMIGLGLMMAGVAFADDDWGFNYQAEIRDADGKVIVDGTGAIVHKHIVTIMLYDKATGGSALWGRKFDVRGDDNGLFNVFLSDSEGYPVIADKEIAKVIREHSPGGLYIGLTVGDGTEILPRQRLCAVPFANLSQNLAPGATAIGDLTVASNCTVNGSCTASNCTLHGNCTVSGTMQAKEYKVGSGTSLVAIPVGGIIMWTKTTAPDGGSWNSDGTSHDGMWAQCDGQNGRPDMRGRFPVGVGDYNDGTYSATYSYNNEGGEYKHTLIIDEMPKHDHKFMPEWGVCSPVWSQGPMGILPEETAGANVFKHTPDNCDTGGDVAHENRPPYRAVYFIMRVK